MDDNQVIKSVDKNPIKRKINRNTILAAALLCFALVITTSAYFFGKNSASTQSPIPTQNPFPTTILFDINISPTTTVVPTSPGKTASVSISPKSSATSIEKVRILNSKSALDGYRSSNNIGNNTLEIKTGRNADSVTRGFVTFEIEEIPFNSIIKSATLRLYQSKVTGNPYRQGGPIQVDHLTYGDALDSTDYGLPALTSNVTILSKDALVDWKEADVTAELKNDIANSRSTSQYRIHFTTEVSGGNESGEYSFFDSGNSYPSNSGRLPQLVIKYF